MLAPSVDVVIVVGSPTSSNSNRLQELAQRLGINAYMVDQPDDLRPSGSEGGTASASRPVRRRRTSWFGR